MPYPPGSMQCLAYMTSHFLQDGLQVGDVCRHPWKSWARLGRKQYQLKVNNDRMTCALSVHMNASASAHMRPIRNGTLWARLSDRSTASTPCEPLTQWGLLVDSTRLLSRLWGVYGYVLETVKYRSLQFMQFSIWGTAKNILHMFISVYVVSNTRMP